MLEEQLYLYLYCSKVGGVSCYLSCCSTILLDTSLTTPSPSPQFSTFPSHAPSPIFASVLQLFWPIFSLSSFSAPLSLFKSHASQSCWCLLVLMPNWKGNSSQDSPSTKNSTTTKTEQPFHNTRADEPWLKSVSRIIFPQMCVMCI